MKSKNNENKSFSHNLIFACCFLSIIMLLLIRCFYGLGIEFSDEYSQPAVVKRFMHGDRLLIDDWQPATTLIGYFLYCILLPFRAIQFNIIQLRFLYVIFQILISGAVLFFLGASKTESKICAVAYLVSTPYGIMSICYNTVAIGFFVLFLALICCEYKLWKRILAGVMLDVSVLAIPHIVIVFFIYLLVILVMNLAKKELKSFEFRDLKALLLGIAILFVPFCIILFLQGGVNEYILNLRYIFGDVEHNEYSLPVKFVRALYQLVRVYWRAWVPLFLTCIVAFVLRNRKYSKKYLYFLTCIIVIYATFRFAFIYGSVSINLMIIPMFYWGISAVTLMIIWGVDLSKYYYEIIWILAGLLFAICDYLATNTEILSMSAMFIVADIAVILLNIKFIREELPDMRIFAYATSFFFITCLLIQRMTYIWGDGGAFEYDVRIDSGIAKGIYTTNENAEQYYMIQEAIERAEIDKADEVLFVPSNPLYYLSANGGIASPYVIRFDTEVSELNEYYQTHDYKRPDKVIIFEDNTYNNICSYFIEKGYDLVSDEDCYDILHR